MPDKPNKLIQFWQELKRRRVIHVLILYATSAFVLIEIVNNLAVPLNLPAILPIIIIIVLAIGFPLAVTLSWLFDLTSTGFERTKTLSKIPAGEKPVVPDGWKIATYVSFVVIIGLVILNIMGGGKQIRDGDIQSLVILPFDNNAGNDQLDDFVSGTHSLLIREISQINGLRIISRTSSAVYQDTEMSSSEIARELDVDVILEGQVIEKDDSIYLCVKVIRLFPNEDTLWCEEYMEAKSQMQYLYNRINKQIANKVRIELSDGE